jgi:putative ABC transport system permease protein
MIFVGVFAGITFGGYATNLEPMYDALYEDSESGGNLADLWVDNKFEVWTPEQVDTFCTDVQNNWPNDGASLDTCEGRMIVDSKSGRLFHTNNTGNRAIPSIWHGIPANADIDRIWFPEGHSQGRVAEAANEIVMDAHMTEILNLSIGDQIEISGGNGIFEFDIVGIAYHPLHIYLVSEEGSIFPPKPGDLAIGYLSDLGMARMTGNEVGSANNLMLDIEGTPAFDLPDTDGYEGEELDEIKLIVANSMEENELDGRIRDRGQNDAVEFMRQDLEGAKKMATPFTVMIQAIAAITIALSLQRLVQSQAREIAILRTLGVSRSSLMTGYLIAPLAIGAFGCGLGIIAGPYGMNGMLDYYEVLIGLPITERSIPLGLYGNVIGITMIIVFISGVFPAWKATRMEPLDVLGGHTELRIGSNLLRKITSWMPTKLGLSIRSSLRKPIRLSMTFLAVGISLMLAGSIQMMTVGLTDTIVGGLDEGQTWDISAGVVNQTQQDIIVEWAEERGVNHELIIELPSMGEIEDSSGMGRAITLIALNGYEEGESMRSVDIIAGNAPLKNSEKIQVMMDEGSIQMAGWAIGEIQTIEYNGLTTEVEITGSVRGEISRTMFFLQSDLASISDLNATSVYLQIPEGVDVNSLNENDENNIATIEREVILDGIETLLEQQTQVLATIMGLGVLFTLAVMFNTMVMNIAERDFELATLRVLGASTVGLGTMLLFESILIGFVGGLVGVAFAFGGAIGLAGSFSTWQFYFPVVLVPSVAYQLMGIVLLIAIAMVPIGIWRIRRMDLVEKVKDLAQ